MSQTPLVSVLIPCCNAAATVGAAIESVLAQTYQRLEIVAVDDGSSDRSAQVIAGYAANGVRLIRQPNRGASASRNHALAQSHGELVLFLDADDLIAPDHIAELASRVEPDGCAVAMGQWDRFVRDPDDASFPPRRSYRDAAGPDWLCEDWIDGQPMTQCGMFLIPRRLLDRVGGWDERLGLIDDFEFFARILSRCDGIRFAADARLYYRSGLAGSLSGQVSRTAAQSACLSLLEGTAHLLAARDDPRSRRACANMLRTFDYTFYPSHPDLRDRVSARIRALGGSDLAPPGPPAFQALRRLIGWKPARRIQLLRDTARRRIATA